MEKTTANPLSPQVDAFLKLDCEISNLRSLIGLADRLICELVQVENSAFADQESADRVQTQITELAVLVEVAILPKSEGLEGALERAWPQRRSMAMVSDTDGA